MTTLLPIDSTATLVKLLRDLRRLQPPLPEEVLRRLVPQFPEPRALARHLMLRGWLTPYQARQLFPGRGRELVLGEYCILESLDASELGQVFKARQQRMNRVVALKVIRTEVLA